MQNALRTSHSKNAIVLLHCVTVGHDTRLVGCQVSVPVRAVIISSPCFDGRESSGRVCRTVGHGLVARATAGRLDRDHELLAWLARRYYHVLYGAHSNPYRAALRAGLGWDCCSTVLQYCSSFEGYEIRLCAMPYRTVLQCSHKSRRRDAVEERRWRVVHVAQLKHFGKVPRDSKTLPRMGPRRFHCNPWNTVVPYAQYCTVMRCPSMSCTVHTAQHSRPAPFVMVPMQYRYSTNSLLRL